MSPNKEIERIERSNGNIVKEAEEKGRNGLKRLRKANEQSKKELRRILL